MTDSMTYPEKRIKLCIEGVKRVTESRQRTDRLSEIIAYSTVASGIWQHKHTGTTNQIGVD